MHFPNSSSSNLAFRKSLRSQPTPGERELWGRLPHRQSDGVKFRRQHSIGPFVLDFYCHEARLAVEMDGSVQGISEQRRYDGERDERLNEQGIKVLRIQQEDFFADPDAVVRDIVKEAVTRLRVMVQVVQKEDPPQSPLEGGWPNRSSIPHVLCILGPTASGKSALALRLARERNGEIINADARQLYRGFEIGTGVPNGERQSDGTLNVEGIPHHLYATQDPRMPWTVIDWRDQALQKMREIVGRGKLPIIVGGTGLFIRALVDNPQFPEVPPQLEWRAAQSDRSLSDLVLDLQRLDPDLAASIDLKNPRRVLRALEIVTFGGVRGPTIGEPLVDAEMIGIDRSREELHARIEASVREKIAAGWIDEVQVLIPQEISLDLPAWNAIGYRELRSLIENRGELEQIISEIITKTKQYAKRQMTWFRKEGRIRWIIPQAPS